MSLRKTDSRHRACDRLMKPKLLTSLASYRFERGPVKYRLAREGPPSLTCQFHDAREAFVIYHYERFVQLNQ
jgi:hypothetical protein